MGIFNRMAVDTHEQVIFCNDGSTGLKAIIAIHDTTLGPALGGCRMYPYDTEENALEDVLRLSKGMTFKSAVSGLNFGGGKAVIIGDPKKDKTEVLLRSFGRFVETLNGRYKTAEDVGTNVADMEIIRKETIHVTGIPMSRGGGGDPSVVTAFGIFKGIKACLEAKYGDTTIKGKIFAIQGIGSVGLHLAENIFREGGELLISDIDSERLSDAQKRFKATIVKPGEILGQKCHVLSPCALGGIVNQDSIKGMQCDIIAGSANNQLRDEECGGLLLQKGIIYAPDYVINAGGLINVAEEISGYNRQSAMENASSIFYSVKKVLDISKKENIPSNIAANKIAEARLEAYKKFKRIHLAGC